MALPNKFLYFSTLAKFNNKKSQINKNTVSFIQETGQIYVDTSVGSAYFGGNSGVFAQKVHDSSTASTYGAGTANSFGHVKVSDTYTSNVGNAASSIAASQNAVYSAYTALTGVVNSKITSGNLNTINEHSLENSGTTSNWNYFTSILGTDASAGGILSVSDVQTKIQDTTHRLVTDASINAWNAKTSNTGTVTKVATGTGLTVSPTSANSATYTVSPNLNSSTSLGTLGTTNKLYAVGVDASGKLCVSVPWDNTVYTHPASSLGTKTISATTGKFIKSMSVDASGHVTALTDASIVLNDISTLKATTNAYGITQLSSSTSSTSTSLAATPSAVKAAYDLASTALATANSKTSNVGTVTQVKTGDGLTVSPTSANGATYTVSPNLDNTTSLGTIGTTSQLYAVGLDANKKLCVSVPWEDTIYTHPASSLGTKTISATTGKFIKSMAVDASGHVTALTDASIVLNDISTLTATTNVYGITKLSSSTSSTSTVLAATPSAVKSAYDLASTALATANSKTSNVGTVTQVLAGVGLSVSGTTANAANYTVRAKLKSDSCLGTIGTTSKLYAVGVDSSGNLGVSVPWDNTVYTHPASSLGTKTITYTAGKALRSISVDASGHVTSVDTSSLGLVDISTIKANTSNYGIVKMSDTSTDTSTGLVPTSHALSLVQARAEAAYALADSKTSNVGTVTQVKVGDGLTVSGTAANAATYTVSPNLNSTASLGTIGTTSKLYAVGIDNNKKLCVAVPWTDTTANQTITLSGDVTGAGTTSITTTIGTGKVTNAMLSTYTDASTDISTAYAKVASTKAVANYAVKKSGDVMTGDLVLHNPNTASGMVSPSVVFQRATETDGYVDWKINADEAANLALYKRMNNATWTKMGSFDYNTGAYSGQAASAVTANTATTATKLGTTTVGAYNRPIYINDGTPTVCNPGEAFLTWGGQNFSGSYGPIDAAMIPELGANRLAFLNPSTTAVEYSKNGGSTWIDYGATDTEKIALVSGLSGSFVIGKSTTSQVATANDKLRITIEANGLYTILNKFAIYVSTNGSTGCTCTVMSRTRANYDSNTDTWVTWAENVGINGWSGWNIINIPSGIVFGNNASQCRQIRFIFSATGHSGGSYAGLTIVKLLGFGGQGWATPSQMALNGHLYSYDANKNATFPANVTATTFIGTLTGNATTATTATKLGTADKGDASTFIYLNDGVPTNSTKLANSAWITAGTAAGNMPLIGTALGTTNNNIVVTDAAGKLKPSGTVIGAAAGKSVIDASSGITSSATGLTTGKAVYNYVIDLQKAFKYEGTVSADSGLAATAPKGSVYFASAGFTLSAAKSSTGAAQTIEKGDMIVGNGSKWDVVQANWTAADGSASLTWGTSVTLATIGGVTINAQLPPDPLSLATFTNTVRYKNSSTATSGTITLSPNHFYVFSNAWNGTTVTIARAAEVTSGSSAIVNEYAGRFTTGATAPTVTFTNVSKWNEDKPTIEANSEYEFSIVDDRGILTKLKTF